jgi:hypothetical protein
MAENPAAHGEFLAPSKNLAAHGGKPGGAWRVRGAIKKPGGVCALAQTQGKTTMAWGHSLCCASTQAGAKFKFVLH